MKSFKDTSNTTSIETSFLIIGGGIAGVSCLETLRHICPEGYVTLVTESTLVKTVSDLVQLGKSLTRFSVLERSAMELDADPFVHVITGDRLKSFNSSERLAVTENGCHIKYRLLCLCTGARPHLIPQAANYPEFVIGIRDTESVSQFEQRLSNAKRITIVGNGGIAAECAFAVRSVHVDWIIKDAFVAQTLADPGAAEFFRTTIQSKELTDSSKLPIGPVKRMRYDETVYSHNAVEQSGSALGPDWHRKWQLLGAVDGKSNCSAISIHPNCEVSDIERTPIGQSHRLFVYLNNGIRLESDLIVSATGVKPEISFECTDQDLHRSEIDGGLLVDEFQRTNVDGVYAAGDCCTANWEPRAEHWHQMRLWTQARQMGCMAGRAMAAKIGETEDELLQDFCFELFGHVTQLFGYQIVLLGKFNGQGLGNDYEALIRTTPQLEYIKYVIKDGRVQGAILIGETGLEETTENLILNGLDVSQYGERLLDPEIDIEDYFD